MNGIVKLSLAAVTVLSFLLSVTPVIADEGEYRPEFGTLAEHNQWATKAVGIDKVAALGFEGEGVKVAVLDSGISMSTPGISNKVVAYKDFLPSQQPLPDHGTQAIGTISNDFDAATGIRGVAPKASIIVARVCYMSSCDSAAISQGFAWAIEQGAQVISMSFGGGPGSMQNPQILAAVKAGVLVVAAAGNSACKPVEYWGVNRNCIQGVISEGYPAS
jgi:subtilisin family serine protease